MALDDAPRPYPGTPGSSARRELERRMARYDTVTAEVGSLRRLVRNLVPPPQTTQAWATGPRGELAVARVLSDLTGGWVYALHERRIPGSRANIDHIAISASGIHVIDAKLYRSPVVIRRSGGLLSPRREQLLVGGRDRTSLLTGLAPQVQAVRTALHGIPDLDAFPVRSVLCFVESDLGAVSRRSTVAGVHVLGLRPLRRQLSAPGPFDARLRYRAYRRLADALSPLS